jgi:hypothetical protein
LGISFREIALDLKQGTLYFGLQAVQAASYDRLIPEAVKQQLDINLEDVQHELDLAKSLLDAVREDTIKGKLTYTFWRGKGSKHQLDAQYKYLKTSCNKLKDLCLQLHNFKTAQSSFLLTSDVFKLHHETVDNRPGESLPDSDIIVATGNYVKRGKRILADFILERRSLENDVRYLCSQLTRDELGDHRGILPALGYRQPPYNDTNGSKYFQLIFELPQNTVRESLAHWICTKSTPDLLERLGLCLDLALAVKSIHSLGLVHKSLRPHSMLILSKAQTQDASRKVYLQDWTYVRQFEDASSILGQKLWQKRIYQHPERQGKYVDAVYKPKHDIYSLGVCILEILLWKSFVVRRSATSTQTSTTNANPEYSICEIYESYGIKRGWANGGLPSQYKGDTVKLTSESWVTKTIWNDIASSELGDAELTKLVLDCLESVFQDMQEVVSYIEAMVKAREKP